MAARTDHSHLHHCVCMCVNIIVNTPNICLLGGQYQYCPACNLVCAAFWFDNYVH